MFGFRTYAVARRIDNPHLDRFLARFRSGTGQTILDKNTDYDRIQQVLREGGAIAMLCDQDAGQRGMFVDFFGRPASTFKSIALLALEYNAALVVVGVPKVGEPMRYQVVSEEVILPEDYADRPDAAKAITQRYTAALERLVRRSPGQYFWLHRRWKTPAAGEKKDAKGGLTQLITTSVERRGGPGRHRENARPTSAGRYPKTHVRPRTEYGPMGSCGQLRFPPAQP